METHFGTVVDVAGVGVLFEGPSGSGKSDLALRMMDRGATLIADDRYLVRQSRRGLIVSAPDSLYGLLEVRGLGIQSMPAIKTTRLALVVSLVDAADVPRLPEYEKVELHGHKLPKILLNAFEQSTPIKIELAAADLDRIGQTGRRRGNNG